MVEDLTCDICHFWRGHANCRSEKGLIFVCDDCKDGLTDKQQIEEIKRGA